MANVSLRDGADRRQAHNFQILLIVWLSITTLAMFGLWLPLLFAPPAAPAPAEAPATPDIAIFFGLLMGASAALWLTPLSALIILRRGYFDRSVLVAVSGATLAQTLAAIAMGVSEPSVSVMFTIPILLAGLLGGRRLLLTIAGTNIIVVIVVGILQMQSPPMAGFVSSIGDNESLNTTIGFICGVIILETTLLDRFGRTFRESLAQALEREAELKGLRDSLEQTVAQRTAELSAALNEVQARAAEQAELLNQIEEQQAVIRDLSIPVLPVNDQTLVIPLVGSMDSARMLNLRQRSLEVLEQSRARTLILDVTGVALIDSQVAQGLIQTVQAARLLGAEVLLVGIRPEVAQTMVGLGIQLHMVRTFSSLQAALARSAMNGAAG